MLKRVVTGVVAGATTLVCLLWSEPWGLWALLALLLALGTWELVGLTGSRTTWLFSGVTTALCIGSLSMEVRPLTVAVVLFLVGGVGIIIWQPNQSTLNFLLTTWLVSGCFASLMLGSAWIQAMGDGQLRFILIALIPLWIGDSLAYFIGRRFGRHLMAPRLSPKKSWEGAIANFVGCMATSVVLANMTGLSLTTGIAIGLSTGVLGQVGDLLQSRVKRFSGAKDSGSLLPGHGGVLDRADSFIFSAPASLLLLSVLEPQLFHVKQLPF